MAKMESHKYIAKGTLCVCVRVHVWLLMLVAFKIIFLTLCMLFAFIVFIRVFRYGLIAIPEIICLLKMYCDVVLLSKISFKQNFINLIHLTV